MSPSNNYDRDGVVLLRDCIDESVIVDVRREYDELDMSLKRTEIPKKEPLIVFWKHVLGEQKRIALFSEFPSMRRLIHEQIVPIVRRTLPDRTKRLQLLETIIFNKPAKTSNTLNWHQDIAYFPLQPNNQIAVWIPFEPVNKQRGAMVYALGSHKLGARGSINLHTREPFAGETRELIPEDPASAGLQVVTMDMTHKDMLIHDGYTWHYSGPNVEEGYTRRGLSVRFITDEAVFQPRPGQGAAFTQQIEIQPGEVLKAGGPFPLV